MSLIEELKRRNVFKVSAAYLALAWVVIQITASVVPALNLPASINAIVVWAGLAGFPFVVLFAWIYELTPEGLKRESEVDRSSSITHQTGRKLDYIIIGLLVAAIAMFAFDRLSPRKTDIVGAGHAHDSSIAEEEDRGHGPLPQQEPTPTPAQAVVAPDDKSIAVLPFADMSQAKDQEYFSDGIAEELLNLLAKVPELKVIARTSSFAFKGEKLGLKEIAKRLNVAHVLEGSVRKSGNKVRITAQLVRASDSVHVWSETYDRSLDDIFAVQDEIAQAVVTQLKIALLGGAPKAQVGNPEAFSLLLQARHMANQLSPEGNTRAVALYQQALALEPGNAVAWDGLARVYNNMASVGQLPEAEAGSRAMEAARNALSADPLYAPAHARVGFLILNSEADAAAAAVHYRHALELAPGDPDVITLSVQLLQNLGRLDAAIAAGRYVTTRDPVNAAPQRILCLNLVLAGHFDEAIAACNNALALSPGMNGANYQLGVALLGKGDAVAALEAFENEKSDEEYALKGKALALHTLGRRAEFEQVFATLRERYGAPWPSEIAQVYAWSGDADQCFAWLDKAVAQKEGGLGTQFLLPFYKPVQSDARWLAFRERTGSAEAQLTAIPFDVKLPQ